MELLSRPLRPGLFVALLVLACAVPALLPGDAPWINDEPQLISLALDANAHHALATVGLQGTHGVRYGPLPTWLYQGYLAVSHDLEALVVIRSLLMMAGIAMGLLWVADALEVGAWLVFVPLVSPYVYLYSRQLWDNTFCLPLSVLALGGYSRFLKRGGTGGLVLAVLCAAGLLLVHLQAVALVLPLSVHAVVFAPRALWARRWALVPTLAVAALALFPYARAVLHERPAEVATRLPPGWWSFPLLGARLLSAQGLDYFFDPGWTSLGQVGALVRGASAVTWLVFLGSWAGILVALWEVLGRPPLHVRQKVLWLLLGVLAAQGGLVALTGAVGHPHYYVATWGAPVGLLWVAASRLPRALAALLTGATTAALGVVVVFLVVRIHGLGGTRTVHYGPVLKDQLAIARQLKAYPPPSRIFTDVPGFRLFPHALTVLMRLEDDAPPVQPPAVVRVGYAAPPPSAHLALWSQALPSPPAGAP